MKEKLIKFVMERADKCYSDDFPIPSIQEWINEFYDQYQIERSRREDINYFAMKAEFKEDGLCYFENGQVIDPNQFEQSKREYHYNNEEEMRLEEIHFPIDNE